MMFEISECMIPQNVTFGQTSIHEWHTQGLGGVNVAGISKEADLQLGAGDVREQQCATETLVALGVVVLEGNLLNERKGNQVVNIKSYRKSEPEKY